MATPRTKSKSTTTRATRSKAALKTELEAIEAVHADSEEQDTTAAAAAKNRAFHVREATREVTLESVAQRLATAKIDTARYIDNISAEYLAKAQELEEIKEAVTLEAQELEKLHGKDVVASSIGVLIDEYHTKNNQLEEAFEKRNEQLEQTHDAHLRAFEQEKRDRQNAWTREQQEHQYNLSVGRKKEADLYEETLRQRKIQEEDRQRGLQLSWGQRENELSAKEGEFSQLKEQVAGFDAKLKSETDKHVAMATNSLKKDLTHQMDLAKAGHDAKVAILEGQKAALESEKGALSRQILTLTESLNAANKSIQELGTSALNSASGQQALNAIQQQFANGGQQNKPAKA